MARTMDCGGLERYRWEEGRYVLYVGVVPVLATRRVAVLLDVRLGALVTHGDVGAVHRELEEMRRLSRAAGLSRCEADWLLLEGCPQVEELNWVICCPEDLAVHKEAFLPPERCAARQAAQALLACLAKRGTPPLRPGEDSQTE